jgi:hypothetical protein
MKVNWAEARTKLTALTDEELRIVEMLAERKTMPDIGKTLGQHRSMIWRKVQKLKKRLLMP